jgi:ATPase subunit of ABC transporter with duplicated ATPase domains
LLGKIQPSVGNINIAEFNSIYIDQEYSLIDNEQTLYDFVQTFNDSALQESEVKTLLSRFLFSKHTWDKMCGFKRWRKAEAASVRAFHQ